MESQRISQYINCSLIKCAKGDFLMLHCSPYSMTMAIVLLMALNTVEECTMHVIGLASGLNDMKLLPSKNLY